MTGVQLAFRWFFAVVVDDEQLRLDNTEIPRRSDL